jgi:uncharacterized membrane protein YqiK
MYDQPIFIEHWWIIPSVIVLLILIYKMLLNVGADELATIEVKYFGREMKDGRTVALPGEVGVRAKILGPGLHFLIPFIQVAKKHKYLVVEDHEIGLVEAITGESIPHGEFMARHVECNTYQDGVSFLRNGGQKGPQISIVPPGEHRINPHLFQITVVPATTIAENQIASVESIAGKPIAPGRIMADTVECDLFQDGVMFLANGGQKGPQVHVLTPGMYRINTYLFRVTVERATVVPGGHICMITAMDGDQIPDGRLLADRVDGHSNFEKGDVFLKNGGQKGRQIQHLMPGTYRINTTLFKVSEPEPWVQIPSTGIGVVTVLEGRPITSQSNIAADEIDLDLHKNYQDAYAFLKAGGQKGLQIPVLRAGAYAINPWFAAVDIKTMIRVEIGFVGVVNSFIGAPGEDVTGATFKHGNIVKEGQRGIWEKTLDPGLYPINPKLQDVLMVPTTNIVLNWKDEVTEEHKLDAKLRTITVRSRDGFTFNLEVSQVINISDKAAPKVIARFGTIENLVSQVLEPTIGNYFRNSAQTSEALAFVDERKERQTEARHHIEKILKQYDIECVDTLIGDINPPPELMKILADRKVAEQQQEMYLMQKASEEKRQDFVKAQTAATKEQELTAARYDKDIATQIADAKVEKAKGDRESAKITADGEAYVLTTVGAAKAENIDKVGTAEAGVILKKTQAMGQEQFAAVQVAEHLASNNIKIVPDILIQGDQAGGNSIVNALIGTELFKNRSDIFKKEEGETSSPDPVKRDVPVVGKPKPQKPKPEAGDL